jgi:GNAT superfamily N-acetyltransferase
VSEFADLKAGAPELATPLREHRRGELLVTTNRAKIDLDVVHGYLASCYWAGEIPRDVVEKSIRLSYCFSVLDGERQVGFARVLTDFATYAYICDVFVLDSHRGRGLGKWLVQCIREDADLQGLRRWSLVTRDAHGLYRHFGFQSPGMAERYMEIVDSDIYKKERAVEASSSRT